MESMNSAKEYFGGGIITGSGCTRRTVMQLVKKGLAKSIGLVEQCDDDGFTHDNRQLREAFDLTPLGEKVAVEEGIIEESDLTQ